MSGIELQRAFAARIRDPEGQALLPGIAVERMALYEALFFNNLERLLSSAFPVLRRLLDEPRWRRLVRAFMGGHRCRTAYFLEISQEFLAWLQQGYPTEPGDPPFILELAHYEWVELALDVAEDELPVEVSRGELLAHPPRWSALAWPLAYAWPVNRIGVDFQPQTPPAEPTCLLVWRDRNDQVRFMQLAPFAYRLALRLQAGGELSGETLLRELAASCGLTADGHYLEQGRALLDEWRRSHILL